MELKLEKAILEILIESQFRAWIDEPEQEQTANEVEFFKDRAIGYYNGQVPPDEKPFRQTQFRAVVNQQLVFIIKAIDNHRTGISQVDAEKIKGWLKYASGAIEDDSHFYVGDKEVLEAEINELIAKIGGGD